MLLQNPLASDCHMMLSMVLYVAVGIRLSHDADYGIVCCMLYGIVCCP